MFHIRWRNRVPRQAKVSAHRGNRVASRRANGRLLFLEGLEDRTLLAAGVLDPTFGAGGLAITNLTYTSQNSLAVQPDGKFVVAGISNGPTNGFSVARFNADGSPDAVFNANGFAIPHFSAGSIDRASALALQSDGKIIVAGSTNAGPGGTKFGLVRLNTDGTQDPDFGFATGGFVTIRFGSTENDRVAAVAVQTDGRIVVAGTANDDWAVARLHTDGLQDSDFNGNGKVIDDLAFSLTGGKVTGSIDALTSMALQPDGQIIIAGYTNTDCTNKTIDPQFSNFAVARINGTNGLFDSTFGGGIINLDFFHALFGGDACGGDDKAYQVAVQPDNKIVVAGLTQFGGANNQTPLGSGSNNFGLARFNIDGSLDKTFNGTGLVSTDFSPNFLGSMDQANSLVVEGDGKIILAGVTDRNGSNDFALVRYNTNGTEDQTFGLHGQVVTDIANKSDDAAKDIVMQADGKILVAGTSNNRFVMARYSALQSGSFQFSAPTYSVKENGGSITITVTRGGGTENTVTVDFATSDGTAKAGTDYTATSGTLTFAPGESSKTFTVAVKDDGVFQPVNKTFNLTLSNATGGALVGFQKTAIVTIVETNQAGTLQFNAATYSVPKNGGNLTVTVTRTNGSDGMVSVNFQTSNGTAIAGTDYTATTGTLTFAVGETSKTFTIPILNNGVQTPDLTFTVTLLTPMGGAALGTPDKAVVTIVNTNQAGTVQFSAAAYSVAENGGNLTVTVTRGNGNSGAIAVDFATHDGTAVAGTNYTATSGTLNFAAGENSKTITIPVKDDAVFSPANLTFTITLSNPTNGAALGRPSAAVITLIEKDGTANQLFVAQAYRDLLQREADVTGIATFVSFLDAGGTRQQVALQLESSQEYRTLVVQRLYNQYLKRSADQTGLATFVAQLAAGATVEQVSAALVGSAEYFQTRGGGTNSGFLTALYKDALNRTIDDAGKAGFNQMLANGVSRTDLAAALFSSNEYLQDLVQGFYLSFLRRPGDSAGVAMFVNLLQPKPPPPQPIFVGDPPITQKQFRDEEVIALFVGSQEYLSRLS
jgi:uncharacterized delta-60 repeat protein